MLGDVHIAEPGALIGFAGPRVIEQTIREKLPEGFQRAEHLMQHGMVDMVVSRLEMKATICAAAEADAEAAGARGGRDRNPRRRQPLTGQPKRTPPDILPSGLAGELPKMTTLTADQEIERLMSLHPKL